MQFLRAIRGVVAIIALMFLRFLQFLRAIIIIRATVTIIQDIIIRAQGVVAIVCECSAVTHRRQNVVIFLFHAF